ncbi:hypothetical protein [Sandaracinus amylolyticus]|uniref:hypothetical protein n=1 Tax=Sandaracinus amylolyticus TaxID=927083 RepID=UPI001F3005CC|nr:hypothetical protein [Sandaracinus amylolyticus]UJR83721.1 Hypothetical protein I5071_57920 [Sandaracinus amylolyticus]
MNDRFELTDELVMGSKLRNRGQPGDRSSHPGDFLARLWALFGQPPRQIDGGFEYTVRDRSTGLAFHAYSGASGPAYGASWDLLEELAPVLDAFDALLDRTAPAEVELELCGDDEHRPGDRWLVGVRRGEPFEREVRARARKSPGSATNADECEAIAKTLGGPYGISAGFQRALDELVDVPSEVHFGGRTYRNCIGLAVQSETGPVLLFDEGPGIEELGIDEALGGALSAKARLWLDAYARWHDAQGLSRRALRRR